ncbi:MAG TPA: hypothetical protein P5137_11845, partial [Candidatus Brocadiia bacterium]|nr:hypothetical protein [Candidatus Brocadiia bacterium]
MSTPLFPPVSFSSGHVSLSAAFHLPQISCHPDDRALARVAPLASGGSVFSTTVRAEVPGLGSGQMTTDAADFAGIAISRQVLRAGDGRLAVRGVVENRSPRGVCLGEWPIFAARGEAGLRLDSAPASQWKMFRNGRHKNDHPVVVTLGQVDANYLDAAGAGSETGDQAATRAPLTLVSDPMTVLRAGRASLLAGFLSQLEHLSFIAVAMTPDRRDLDSLAAVAEFDGCLLPPGARRETSWLVLDAGPD